MTTTRGNQLTGAEAFVRMLQLHDVKYIFGLCGDTSLPLYDALYRLDHGMTHILTRDERSAAYMADGYARVSGKVDAPLARSSKDRLKVEIVEEGRGKRAVTHWKKLKPLKQAALVECQLETGRTHQVRVHMASIGHPLVGDPVYARGKSNHSQLLNELDFRRQALHAASLGFVHPVTKDRLSFESALPPDIQELLSRLGV